MKISNISVKNFKKIRELDISIPEDNRVICFVGENGSNKSSLLSSIYTNIRMASTVESPSCSVDRYVDNLNHVTFGTSVEDNYAYVSLSLLQNHKKITSTRAVVPSYERLSKSSKEELRGLLGRFYSEKEKFPRSISNLVKPNVYEPDFLVDSVLLFRPTNRFECPTWERQFEQDKEQAFKALDSFVGKRKFPYRVVESLESINGYFLEVLLDALISERAKEVGGSRVYDLFYAVLKEIEPSVTERYMVSRFPRKSISFNNVPELGSLSAGQSDWFVTAVSIIIQMAELVEKTSRLDADIMEIEGVVFIDEMDKNFHPIFQEKVLPWFIDFFPNIQFVISTHSPYMIRSLGENALVVKLPSGEVLDDDFSYYDINEVALKVFGQDQGFSPKIQSDLLDFKIALSESDNEQALALYNELISKSESLDRELNRIVYSMANESFVEGLQ